MNAAEQLMKNYESLINEHDFSQVQDLISPSAVFWFNDGQFVGHSELRRVFEKTWSQLQNERYWITDLKWLSQDHQSAACIYTFNWEAKIDGKMVSGRGRGTSILRSEEGKWKIAHEHLSQFPKAGG